MTEGTFAVFDFQVPTSRELLKTVTEFAWTNLKEAPASQLQTAWCIRGERGPPGSEARCPWPWGLREKNTAPGQTAQYSARASLAPCLSSWRGHERDSHLAFFPEDKELSESSTDSFFKFGRIPPRIGCHPCWISVRLPWRSRKVVDRERWHRGKLSQSGKGR